MTNYELFLNVFNTELKRKGNNMFNEYTPGNIDLSFIDDHFPQFCDGLEKMEQEMTLMFGDIFRYTLEQGMYYFNFIKRYKDTISDGLYEQCDNELINCFGALQYMLNVFVCA